MDLMSQSKRENLTLVKKTGNVNKDASVLNDKVKDQENKRKKKSTGLNALQLTILKAKAKLKCNEES